MKKTSRICIRPVKKSDLTTVYRLARTPHLAAPSHAAAERWWIKAFLAEQQPFFIATVDDQIVGFILGECATGKVAIAHLLAVDSRYRRLGVGALLGRQFERACRQRGMTCILLYASNHDRYFRRELQRFGYAVGSPVREYQKFLR